jgi:(E)-4-hydroxy-3-methylbut-2-enyl-diphosphate synthase
VKALVDSGCKIIRFAISNRRDLSTFIKLQPKLPREKVALVADLHFGSTLAMEALDHFDKVRINPGNFGLYRTPTTNEHTEVSFSRERARVHASAVAFFRRAKKLGRAVRIGCNAGSVATRMHWRHRNGDDALLNSAWEFLQWAREENFSDIVISIKASDCLRTVALNRKKHRRMAEEGPMVPLHIGVTEAGNGISGRVRAALGIGTLLSEDIGATLRVSLAEPPEQEMEVANGLLRCIASSPLPASDWERLQLTFAEDGIHLNCSPSDGIVVRIWKFLHQIAAAGPNAQLNIPGNALDQEIVEEIFQVCGWGKFHTEIIACPTCGRTGYDVAAVVDELRQRLGNLPGLRIAVMGCMINGIGEMGNSDYGYIGGGKGTVNLYRRGNCIQRDIPEKNAIDVLEQLINSDRKLCERPLPDHYPSDP